MYLVGTEPGRKRGDGGDPLDVGWEDEQVGFAYLFGAVRRQFFVLFLAPLLLLALVGTYLLVAEPLYTATASIHVNVDTPAPTENTSPLDTHVELIRSDQVAWSVIKELNLDEVLQTRPGRLMQAVLGARRWLGLETGESWSELDKQSFMIRQVLGGLGVQQVGNTSIIAVRFTSPRRPRSVEVANAFATAYLADVSGAESRSLARRTERLQERAAAVRRQASSADETVRRLLSQNDFAVTSAEDLDARVAELRQRLSTVDADAAALRARLSSLSRQDEAETVEVAALQTEETLEIYEDMTAASSKLARLRQQPGVSEETIARLEESVAGMRTSLERAVRRVRDELELELAVLAARRASLVGTLDAIMDSGRSEAWADLLDAQREADIYENIHQSYVTELESVNRTGADDDVTLVSRARPPVNPSYPDYKVLIVLAVTLGIALGGGLAMSREWTRNHVRTRARDASAAPRPTP